MLIIQAHLEYIIIKQPSCAFLCFFPALALLHFLSENLRRFMSGNTFKASAAL